MSFLLKEVCKSFGSDKVLDNVSVSIERGDFFAVLGPSGCGKTTLLRVIAGLETLDSGEILINNRVVAARGVHVPPETRNVGVVFQSYALWPHMNVTDNVSFPVEAAGGSRTYSRTEAEKHLKTVELQDFGLRKPAELSGGQRQRVALARCLAQRAETILMDEPLANLDPHLRMSMERELMRFHCSTDATILYITHDQREAMALANRLAVMWQGKILQIAAPDVIYRQPVSERVARFIGHSTIVDAEVLKVDGQTAQVQIAQFIIHVECPANTSLGPVRVVLRPNAIVMDNDTGAINNARVESTVYRGGYWEAEIVLEGIDTRFNFETREHIARNDKLSVRITNGWVLPS